MTEPVIRLRLTVSASDLAVVIRDFMNCEMPQGWEDRNRRAYGHMNRVVGNPFGEVDWRIADLIVCAMGVPHVLVNGKVEVLEGDPVPRSTAKPVAMREGYLPAQPFQLWMREYKENYPTQTAMYNDLLIPYVAAKNYMKMTTKYIPLTIIQVALSRAGVALTDLYPKGEHGYRDFQVG